MEVYKTAKNKRTSPIWVKRLFTAPWDIIKPVRRRYDNTWKFLELLFPGDWLIKFRLLTAYRLQRYIFEIGFFQHSSAPSFSPPRQDYPLLPNETCINRRESIYWRPNKSIFEWPLITTFSEEMRVWSSRLMFAIKLTPYLDGKVKRIIAKVLNVVIELGKLQRWIISWLLKTFDDCKK